MELELETPIVKGKEIYEDEEDQIKNHKWYHVNVNILPAKFAYTFEFVRMMTYTPNLVLFLTGIGLSKTESGIIMGFRSIGQLIGGPFWGIIADKWKCHKVIVVIICILSLMSMCSQAVVALYYGDPITNRCPVPLNIDGHRNTTLSNILNSSSQQNSSTMPETSKEATTDVSYVYLFWLIMILQIASTFSESNSTFIDTATLRNIELSPRRKIDFGRQRMFGAVGGTLGVVVGNLAVFNSPFSSITCYAGFFIPFSLAAIGTAISIEFLYKGLDFSKPAAAGNTNSENKPNNEFRKILIGTLWQKEIILFFGMTFMAGIFTTPRKFMYLYLKELNSPEALYTLSICAAGVTAFIGYGFSKSIIGFFGSTWKSMAFSFVVYGLRHFGFALVKNPWLIILAEFLHMFSYCLFVASGIYHIKNVSPAPIITTMTSIYNALFYAVGPMVGLPLSGLVYEKYGSRNLYRGAAVINVISGIVLGILAVFVLNKKKQRNKSEEEQNENFLLQST